MEIPLLNFTKEGEEIESLLSKKLLELFFYNSDIHAKQLRDNEGKVIYHTIHHKIDATKIRFMIKNQQAIMTYQQNFEKLKWLCLDFDIKKSFLNDYDKYDFFMDNEYRTMLEKEVNKAKKILKELDIDYLLEFSGNRGFHIWIFLKEEVNKHIGFLLLEGLIKKMDFEIIGKKESPITIDMYPKNGKAKGNKIGLGVKIPLSYHLRSNAYSHLIEDIDHAQKLTMLSEDFLLFQLRLLIKVKEVEVSKLLEILDISSYSEVKEYDDILGVLNGGVKLNEVIEMLSKCEIYYHIFSKGVAKLTELDRTVITGTLIRLKSEENENFGRDLLIQYFSSDSDVYNKELTSRKLEGLNNLYPPSIKYLEKIYSLNCNYCKENNITNVFQLLKDIGIETKPKNEEKKFLNWVINSEKKYLTQNDEVSLNFIYDELSNLNIEDLQEQFNDIRLGRVSKMEAFKYFRKEDDDRERVLYSLSAKDRVLSTFAMFEINKILYGQYSSSSYSYRLNYDLSTNDIFINWNSLWLKYVKDIEGKIHSDSYDEYYILKLDISKFYERINHIMLREILYEKPSELTLLLIKELSMEQASEYKNICEYLLDISSQLSNRGVPQGPAYARYLAEIYLTTLDETILKLLNPDFEHYFRYVDDMVILTESKEKADFIYNEIKKSLGTLGLELSIGHKNLRGRVSDLKYKIIGQDIQKYFIDGIDESTTPSRVVNRALEMLDNMFRDEIYNVNVKQLPFYLTHLINNEYLDGRKAEIIREVTKNDLGRGSIFKHFYQNIVFTSAQEVEIEFYTKIKGLSRANFINQLSRSYKIIGSDKLKEIINFYLKCSDLCDYERMELIRLILQSGIIIDSNLLEVHDYELVIRLMSCTKHINWNYDLLKKTLIALQRVDDKSQTLSYLDCLLSNSEDLPALQEVTDTIYATISRNKENIFIDKNIQLINNLICFITMYLENSTQIKDVWYEFQTRLSLNKLQGKIKFNDWYKYNKVIDKSKIIDNSVVHFLTSVFSANGIVPELGVMKLEEEYAMYLFLYLFNSEENHVLRDEIKEKIQEIADGKNLEFLKWCLDEDTSYFPSDSIAIQNIHHNDRVLLKKKNQLLIRGNKSILSDFTEDNIITEDWYKDKEYKYVKVELNTKLQNLYEKFENMDMFDAINLIVELKNSAEKNGKYINVFETGTFRERTNNFYFLYSRHDKKLVLHEEKAISNERKPFLTKLFECFQNASIKGKEFIINYEYDHKNFMKDFIPSHLKGIENIIDFIEILNDKINTYFKSEGESIYALELAKITSLKSLLDRQEVKYHKKELVVLNYYNSLYENDYEKHVLYGYIDLNPINLGSLLDGVIKSIKTNLEHDDINFLTQSLDEEKKYIEEKTSCSNLNDFKLVNIENNAIDNSRVKIDNASYDIGDITFYELLTNDEMKSLTTKEIFQLVNSDFTYFNNSHVVLVPKALAKSIEIIGNKKGEYDKSSLNIEFDIVNNEYFGKAIKNIKIQSDVSEYEAKRRINAYLYGVDSKYFSAILRIIASYLVIDNEKMDSFIGELTGKIEEGDNKCIFPIKRRTDDNGLYQILFQKYKDLFDRKSLNERRIIQDFRKINDNKDINEIIILSDIGLSGNQLKKAFDYYLKENKKKDKMYHDVNPAFFRNFMLDSNVSITLLNCLYSDKYEEEITSYFNEMGFKGQVVFKGNKFNYQDYLFSNIVKEKKVREVFLKFVKEKYSVNEMKFPVKGNKTYEKYLAELEMDKITNVLVARYKSMPKYHHLAFTVGTSVFRYRKD